MSKYPNRRYLPQTIATIQIPGFKAIDTPFGYLGHLGSGMKEAHVLGCPLPIKARRLLPRLLFTQAGADLPNWQFQSRKATSTYRFHVCVLKAKVKGDSRSYGL